MLEIEQLRVENIELRREIKRAEQFNLSTNKCWVFKLERVQLSLDGALAVIKSLTTELEGYKSKSDKQLQHSDF